MHKKDNIALLASLALILLSVINFIFITGITTYTPVWLVIDIVLTIYWICRRNLFCLVMLTCTVLQLFFLPAMICMNYIDKPYETAESIKIATYNVREFKSNQMPTMEHIMAIMDEEDVDVVCFQEFAENWEISDVEFRKRLNKSFPYLFIQDSPYPKTARLAILSKYPLVDGNQELFKNGINGAMSADINIDGNVVRVINCHLQTTGVSQNMEYGEEAMMDGYFKNTVIRKEQADYLDVLVANTTYPTILCGDFNDTPMSYSYRTLNRKLNDGFKSGGRGFASTFIGGFKQLIRIDYIFNSDDFVCTKYKSLNHKFSDHKPVISSLLFRNKK